MHTKLDHTVVKLESSAHDTVAETNTNSYNTLDVAKMLSVCGVDKVLSVDLQRPGQVSKSLELQSYRVVSVYLCLLCLLSKQCL